MITPNTSQVRAMAGRKRPDDEHLPLRIKMLLLCVFVGVAGVAYANF